ncbi:hypothetical protein BBD42_04485 [Paenibacillus sp. BIHB 4019]|uniref:Uncharacterized protein n=1 Tax=Paenibacillus sp. BIHB 4019 TaxID=1870819 RepID=A0A1B2DDN7_9BACL|nr:hypothetical protein BBD42_04485 [Paenibacillus sp. BIHB 4019]
MALVPEGTVLALEGTALVPEGTVLVPEGMALALEGMALVPEGTVLALEGMVLAPEGTVLALEGTALVPEGTALAPAGTVLALALDQGQEGIVPGLRQAFQAFQASACAGRHSRSLALLGKTEMAEHKSALAHW